MCISIATGVDHDTVKCHVRFGAWCWRQRPRDIPCSLSPVGISRDFFLVGIYNSTFLKDAAMFTFHSHSHDWHVSALSSYMRFLTTVY